MANPNIVNVTTIYGKTVGVALSTTSATAVLSNAASSSKIYKVNTLNVANSGATAASITINYYSAAALGGTAYPIAYTVTVPSSSTISIIDKSTPYYLEENTSIGATAGTANSLVVTCSYEDIS